MPSVVAVVQARMTSERMPGKVLADLGEKTVLEHVVDRARAAARVDEVVVATSVNASDDPLEEAADRLGAQVVRGDETDVQARFTAAVGLFQPDVVVRVTGDCPFLDPEVVNEVIDHLVDDPNLDYVSNVRPRSFPRGLDVEAIRSDALLRASGLATTSDEREHVTHGIHTVHAERFRLGSVTAPVDDSDLRWTVDYPEDLEALRIAVDALGIDRDRLPYRQVVDWFRSHPEVVALNSHRATWTP